MQILKWLIPILGSYSTPTIASELSPKQSEFQRNDCPKLAGKWVGKCDSLTGPQSIVITQGVNWCATMQLDNQKLMIGGMAHESIANEVDTSYDTIIAYWDADRKKLHINGNYASKEPGTNPRMRLATYAKIVERVGDKLTITSSTNTKEYKNQNLTNKEDRLKCSYTLVK